MDMPVFEPVVGGHYDLQNMTVILRGEFRGFIRCVRKAEVGGNTIHVPQGTQPLLLFKILRGPGESGYRYAGAHVSIHYDTYHKKVKFTLQAEHFGNTIAQIERHGPQPRYFWRLVDKP
jgi:hypothetical protein